MKIRNGEMACFLVESGDEIVDIINWMKDMMDKGYDTFTITAKHSMEVLKED